MIDPTTVTIIVYAATCLALLLGRWPIILTAISIGALLALATIYTQAATGGTTW